MGLSETERRARTKRRIGCSFAFGLTVGALLLAVIVLYIVFLRPRPDPPLERHIPLESSAVAAVSFQDPDFRNLVKYIAQGSGPKAKPGAGEALDVSDKALEAADFLLHPSAAISIRFNEDNNVFQWVLAANIKRAPAAAPALMRRFLGDGIEWDVPAPGGDAREKRFRYPAGGISGALVDNQIYIASDDGWLEEAVRGSVEDSSASPLVVERGAGASPRLTASVETGQLRRAMEKIAAQPQGLPGIVARRARPLLDRAGLPPILDLEIHPDPAHARILLMPRNPDAQIVDRLRAFGMEIAGLIEELSGGGLRVASEVELVAGQPRLVLVAADLGPWLLSRIERVD